MKSTVQYLDAAKCHLGIPSDYALAKALGVTRAAVSKYRMGTSLPDDLVCAKIADILGCEPMEVIAAINYQRSKTDDARSLWEGIWGKAAGAIALSLTLFAVGLSVAPTSKAAESGNSAQSGDHFALCQLVGAIRRCLKFSAVRRVACSLKRAFYWPLFIEWTPANA